MTTSITKKAYARGIGETLQRRGIVQFSSPQMLKTAADSAASLISDEPAESAVSNADCFKVAEHLSQVNNALRARGKTASFPQGVTIATDVNTALGDMITKLAADVMGGSTAVGMGDHANTPGAAAENSDLARKDLLERPEDYARIMPGGGNIDEDIDAILGAEQPHPKAPADALGTNSVIQASKAASVAETLRKLGMDTGPTAVGMGDHANSLPAAAENSDLARKDLMERPENYAVVGQGNANINESAAANIGTELPHPHQPNDAVGSNSVTDASKTASAQKLASARNIGRNSVAAALRSLAG